MIRPARREYPLPEAIWGADFYAICLIDTDGSFIAVSERFDQYGKKTPRIFKNEQTAKRALATMPDADRPIHGVFRYARQERVDEGRWEGDNDKD